MFNIKELDVTCCHSWEKWGSLAALPGGLLAGGRLGVGLLLLGAWTASSGGPSSASPSWPKIFISIRVGPKGMSTPGRIIIKSRFTTWMVRPWWKIFPFLRHYNQVFVDFGVCYCLCDCRINRRAAKESMMRRRFIKKCFCIREVNKTPTQLTATSWEVNIGRCHTLKHSS